MKPEEKMHHLGIMNDDRVSRWDDARVWSLVDLVTPEVTGRYKTGFDLDIREQSDSPSFCKRAGPDSF